MGIIIFNSYQLKMPKGEKKSEKRIKKEAYWKRLQETARKYNNALFVDANNVSSK